jgi:histidinol dehydrogenase
VVFKLDTKDKHFAQQFDAFLHARESAEADVADAVKDIIKKVRKGGDKAVLSYTQKFDHAKPSSLRVSEAAIEQARKACGKDIIAALKSAARRIRSYHEKQMPQNLQYKDTIGVTLGWRWNAVDAAGIYVPGGTASYPSSVLMNAIPAQVAGVKRIAMMVPMPHGKVNPAVLAAADMVGVKEIYCAGGAQAIAALAYGTETIAPVHKIVGPGNAYVAEAKRQVFGKVGIDMIAGPSEILVMADNKNNPRWIAADLLSQAEHDKEAQSVLITDDKRFAAKVEQAVEATLKELPRAAIARVSWERYGAVILVRDWKEAAVLVDAIAPEHLELAVERPEALAARISHAGAIFLGRHTPEAIGDYIAGPSHVLPTSRTARFSSGLSVYDFLKRTSLIGCNVASLKAIGKDAALLADAEGLDAHALSIRVRL